MDGEYMPRTGCGNIVGNKIRSVITIKHMLKAKLVPMFQPLYFHCTASDAKCKQKAGLHEKGMTDTG